jgi:hypothetical protein
VQHLQPVALGCEPAIWPVPSGELSSITSTTSRAVSMTSSSAPTIRSMLSRSS